MPVPKAWSARVARRAALAIGEARDEDPNQRILTALGVEASREV
jgi:hypothetical protein